MTEQGVVARRTPASLAHLTRFRPRRRDLVLAGAYAVALLAVVLLPVGFLLDDLVVRASVAWTALGLPGQPTAADMGAALNVVMFLPLGHLAVRLTRRGWWQVTAAALALSSCVELYQALPFVPREPSLGDVLTNTLGAALGALVASRLQRRRTATVRLPEQRRA